MPVIPFQTIDWAAIPRSEHRGEAGTSFWRTLEFEGLRLRMVEYSPGYFADHWCKRGHLVHCLEGSFVSELSTGERLTLQKGDSYIVSDDLSSHRSSSAQGVSLLIIDGDFLKNKAI